MLSLEKANALGATSRPDRFASPMRRAAVQKGNLEASADESLFRRRIPCSNKKNSLFSNGTGNPPQALNPFVDRPQNHSKRPESGEVFQNSVLISLFSGNAQRPHRANITKRAIYRCSPLF
jgi:hypothetical protein